jgi:hypothetical protein
VRALRRLEVPKGDHRVVGRYLDGLEIGGSRAAALARSLELRRPGTARRFLALRSGSAATRSLAQSYGLTACRGSL